VALARCRCLPRIENGVPADLVGISCLQIGAAILVAALGREKAVRHLNAALRQAREGSSIPGTWQACCRHPEPEACL
jgi:hypothetical protein